MLDNNAFGELVWSYRKQRGWTQAQLAKIWGHKREYVSQVERGARKLDSPTQVACLAEILDIPQAKLEAIGRGIPEKRTPIDDEILELLLEPGRDMVRLSWLTWYADNAYYIESNLRRLALNLDNALTSYKGQFGTPAKRLLAYVHQMQGKMAFDRLDYAAAGGHFSEMISLGDELNDPDIITLGMTHEGEIFRKRRRYEHALACLNAAEKYAVASEASVKGMRANYLARVYYVQGDESNFNRVIDEALFLASGLEESLESMSLLFSLDDVLQYKAAGYVLLKKPQEALEIYKETDKLRPFRPLRERGSYIIEKARAYLLLGDLDTGIQLALKGIDLASEYRSKLHIGRLETVYSRLMDKPAGRDKKLKELQEALAHTHRISLDW